MNALKKFTTPADEPIHSHVEYKARHAIIEIFGLIRVDKNGSRLYLFPFFSHPSVPVFLLLVSLCWFGAPYCLAGTYTDSAHGQNVSRTALAADYATGNCAHCHEQHASMNGSEPLPADGTPSGYLTFSSEENLCLGCHASSGTVGSATDDIKSDITNSYGHLTANYSGLHKLGETQDDLVDGSAHIECLDCHNPHVAQTGNHSTGTNAIAAPSPLQSIKGVEPTYGGSNWTAPVSYTTQTADKEYQICFKCHSGAIGTPSVWSGTAGSTEWTDVGLEFNPDNLSGHPVVSALDDYDNALAVNISGVWKKGLHNEPDGNTWDQLLSPWTNPGTQTMYCSDCHQSNSSVAGPHGSAYRWMLGGTNKAWPFTTAASNGASSGTYRLIDTLFEWSGFYRQGLGTDNGCFCWNCHPANRNGNNTHMNGNHGGAYCVDCHIRVPHGGKISRLIAAEDSDAYGNIPARYTADGLGNNTRGDTQPVIRKFTKAAMWSYGQSKCYSTYLGGSRSCAYHNNSSYGSESW